MNQPAEVVGEFWRRSPFHPVVLQWFAIRRRQHEEYVASWRKSMCAVEFMMVLDQITGRCLLAMN